MAMLEKILKGLELSEEEARIYTQLLENGALTAGEFSKKVGVTRTSLYSILQRLTDKGVVERTLKKGVRYFSAANPEKIKYLFRQKIENLQVLEKEYDKVLEDLINKSLLCSLSPRFKLYEGVEGVQYILNDMLMYRDIETRSYWPIKSMVDILSAEFFRFHNKERIKRNLYTKAIWPRSEVVDIKKNPFLGMGKDFKREIRLAPEEMNFTMGYWIYHNKIAFLSSRAESFGFIIESQEMVTMMKSLHEAVWNISEKLEIESIYLQGFIDEVNSEIKVKN
jgi:sugar-specific transcriptional regulator TrmB